MMCPDRRLVALIGFGWVGACGAAATAPEGLVWRSREASADVSSRQTSVEFDFAFRNNAPVPVKITGLDSSCRCTSAAPDQASYAAGATGILRVFFAVAGRTGHFEEWVAVTTDPGGPPDRLKIVVNARK